MPRSLSLPILGLVALVVLGIVFEVFLTYRGAELSESSNYLWTVCFSYCVAWWIELDRKSKAIPAPFEYQAFVFFLWPVAAPYYLFQTRKWRGLLQGAGLIVLCCLPAVAALVTYLFTGEPW
jgi:hypothetical protein